MPATLRPHSIASNTRLLICWAPPSSLPWRHIRCGTNTASARHRSPHPPCLRERNLCHEGVWVSGHIDPRVLDSFTSLPLYPRWIGWVVPGTGLDVVDRRQILSLPGLEPRSLNRPAPNQTLFRALCSTGTWSTGGPAITRIRLYAEKIHKDNYLREEGNSNAPGRRDALW
jgi:hypothetical protein